MMAGLNMRAAAGLALAVCVTAPAAVAAQDVRIDSHGLRTGGVVVDSSGVHTGDADVTSTGVHTATHARVRGRMSRGRGVTLMENGRTASIDCAGGPATVLGNTNTLTLSRCSRLSTPGNRNHIVVSLTTGADVEVTGNGNVISYHAPNGAAPRVSSVGTGNRITSD